MDANELLALALDPGRLLRAQGLTPDPWQQELLLSPAPRVLLNCCRGAGKSRVVSALALHQALFHPGSLVLLISRAQRQAMELYRYCKQGYSAVGRPVLAVKETETQLELANGSRIVSLPGKEATIRSYQSVALLIIDEAARVPDDLYGSVSPMTAVSKGRQVILSTPFGQRGFFWREWEDASAPWVRWRIPWKRCPRHSEASVTEERRKFGDAWVSQEYDCSFEAMEGLVYPDFELAHTIMAQPVPKSAKKFGGIDFGWRNPFAAVWGFLDHDDVLWINFERYARETSLHEHSRALPKDHMWYADPSGRTEIQELRIAGHKVMGGYNEIRLGIQAVTARVRTGRLKVHIGGCPNLIAEARLYRYPSIQERAYLGEDPVDDHNHALGALRYLISRIDHKFIGRLRSGKRVDRQPEPTAEQAAESAQALYGARIHGELPANAGCRAPGMDLNNPELWSPI